MANVNSDQITAINTLGKVSSNEMHGRLRIVYFSVPAVPTGVADTVTLCKLPKGARVLEGKLVFSVAQGITATTAIGTATATSKYRAPALTNATSAFVFADLSGTMGLETATEETVIAFNAAAAWTSSALRGYLMYTVD